MKRLLIGGAAAIVAALAASVGAAAPATAGIQLWQNTSYGGDYLGDFGRGTLYVGAAADNRASSVRVSAPANYAILHQYRDHRGDNTGRIYGSVSALSQYGFNDKTTSIS